MSLEKKLEDAKQYMTDRGVKDEALQPPVENEKPATDDAVPEPEAPETVDEPEAEEAQAADTTEYTDVEKEAMEQGWRPDGKKSAEEWMRAGSLFAKIHSKNKKLDEKDQTISELQEQMNELRSFMNQQKEIGYQQAIVELENKRTEAIKNGDVEAVSQIDTEIRNQEVANPAPSKKAIQEFVDRHNSWYNSPTQIGQEMTQFAIQKDNELASLGLDPYEQLRRVEDAVKEQFVEYFEPHKARKAPTVGSDSTTTRKPSKKEPSFNDLNPTQQKIALEFEKRKVMSREKYVKYLQLSGDLK